jgi:glycerol uptake facilitator-like aquaporin
MLIEIKNIIITNAKENVYGYYERIKNTSPKSRHSKSLFSKNNKRESCKNIIFTIIMQELLIEYVGTVFFLYVIIATGNPLAIGAALALAAYIGGPISGGNYNPAVTILMTLAGKQNPSLLIPYVIVQILAALTVLEIYKRLR